MATHQIREAVIVGGLRTPFGRRGGQLSGWHPVELLSHTLKGLIQQTNVDPADVEDFIAGCVDQVGEQALNVARHAWLDAGLPESTPATTVDRQCGSGMQALQFAAQGVMAGHYDLVIAGGVESMTRVPIGAGVLLAGGQTPMTPAIKERYGVDNFNQAIGAEMIAKQWGLSREALDEFSMRSHTLAANATAKGWLREEILPVPIDGTTMEADQGIRPDTSLEKLANLKPAFEGLELLTAGNSSQISDGAAALLVASRDKAEALGLQPLARFVAFSQVGSDPVMMLTGPIPATRKVLQKAGLSTGDIDLFEVNEAFAPVCLAWQEELGVDQDRLNVNGGAIALGHPLGASGARLVLTAMHELKRRGARYALTAICEGGGMTNAAIIERVVE